MNSPVALFVYNRPSHTRLTIEALGENLMAGDSDLIIFSDGPRHATDQASVLEVRNYLKSIKGFKSVRIVESLTNKGLAQSIIEGVTNILSSHDSIIVLEDDMITSPYFLDYMNKALVMYASDDKVISIHGYVQPVENLPETFFLRGADCWGWATWKRGWSFFEPDGTKLLRLLKEQNLTREFDFNNSYSYTKMLTDQINGKNNSWAVRWHASAFLANKLTLFPGRSLINNIGLDDTGTHSGLTDDFKVTLANKQIDLKRIPLTENVTCRKLISQYMRTVDNSVSNKIKTVFAKLLGKGLWR